MKKMYNAITKKIALGICAMFGALSVQATTYTAVASGNFSSNTTWSGSVAPTVILAGDIIQIPGGFTVTLDNDVNFNLAATLDVDGTLTSGTNATALIMTAGDITGSGTIILDSLSMALSSGITYTGDIMVENMSTLASTFNSTADITVNGTLWVMAGITSMTDGMLTLGSGSTIYITGGSLDISGNGSIDLSGDYNLVYQGTSSTTGVEITGSGLQDVTLDLSSGAVTLNNDLMLDGTLMLNNGNLILSGYDLTIGANGDISAMGNGTINSDANANITINSTTGLTGDLTFGTGNNTMNNLTLNLGSNSTNVNLGSDITINGTLTLTQGTLTLNNNDLSFAVNGDFATGGTGMIVSTSGSDIMVSSNNNFTGGIRFSTTGNTVGDLTINMGNNTSYVSLGSDLHVTGMLDLMAGNISTNNNDLILDLGATMNGGSSTSYVITNGGHLTANIAAGNSAMFHIGTMANYTPAMITANTGSVSSDISVMAEGMVYSNGTSGADLSMDRSIVNNTWFISSSATTGLDLDLQLMWDASMEVNSFDRTNAYISHYVNGNWDVMATTSATAQGSLYAMNRSNVTSLSPFIVADNNASLSAGAVLAQNNKVSIYPNPAADVLNVSADNADHLSIFDAMGRKVKETSELSAPLFIGDLAAGYYNVRLEGKDGVQTLSLIKK